MVKMSYCVGEAGRSARESSAPLALMAPDQEEEEEDEPVKSLMEVTYSLTTKNWLLGDIASPAIQVHIS